MSLKSDNKKNDNESKISITTQKQYESIIRTLNSNNIKITPTTTINELMYTLGTLRKVNGEPYKDSSNFLKAIQWLLYTDKNYDLLRDGISTALKNLSNNRELIEDKNILSDEQKKNYLDWSDIIKISRKVKNNKELSKENHKEHVIISLYILFDGVRRVKDYSEMYISSKDELNDILKNYYVSQGSKAYMLFNNYKTSYVYGQQKFMVPTKLKNIINEYIDKYKITGSLLELSEGALKERLKTIFKRYVDKNIGVNVMRHSYITYNEKIENLTKERRKELASRMAHNVDMQLSYIKYVGDIEKPKIRNNKKYITKRGRKPIYTPDEKKKAEIARKKKWRANQKAKKANIIKTPV